MSATAKNNQSAEAQTLAKSPPATTFTKSREQLLSPDKTALPAPQQAARQENTVDRHAERAYIAALRRSIQQMRDGDVQPVREGLRELRRELDADVEDNPVDK